MKKLLLSFLFLIPCILSAQFDCIDGQMMECQGTVIVNSVFGDLSQQNNSISNYTCNGSDLGVLGDGSGQFGEDQIYIFNSIGNSGEFNSMTFTLTMESDDDLDLIVITPDCTYECFSDDSYGTLGGSNTESVTIEWEDEQTIIVVVEAYDYSGSATYELTYDPDPFFDYCSYIPQSGQSINCGNSNFIQGTVGVVLCTFEGSILDCPETMDYHQAEGPYYGYEEVYEISPSSSGLVTIDLDLDPGLKAFLYYRSVDPIIPSTTLVQSGTSFISTFYPYDPNGSYLLVIDSDGTIGDYSFTIDYPGCEEEDPCGDCFTYTDLGNNQCLIDPSLLNPCSSGWDYTNLNTGATSSFNLSPDNVVTFPTAGDYILCYTWNCDVPTLVENQISNPDFGTCCIIVRVGQPCQEPPVAHCGVDYNGGTSHTIDASSSTAADFYSFEFGNGGNDTGTSPFSTVDYSTTTSNIVTTCVVASNGCGMSKYCMTLETTGNGYDAFDCGVPFDIYNPPAITPIFQNNVLTFAGLSQFSGAEMTFDPGDGSISSPWSSNASYNYPDSGPYLGCIEIKYDCYSICFCYTTGGSNFDCLNDPYSLTCNTTGSQDFHDSNSPNSHPGVSVLTDIVGSHNNCTSANDGCDDSNTLSPNVPFNRHEVIYTISNPSDNHNGDITIDLIMDAPNQDLDLFVYGDCFGNGEFTNCIASSTNNNNDPAGLRDAILLQNVPAFATYYVVVDGQSNAPTTNEGPFTISYTCGNLCTKSATSILCGETINDSTSDGTNDASYYCNCENESPNGPAANYGAEKIYRLDISETSTITAELDIITPNVDLELYLLQDCEITTCIRNSRRDVGLTETITKTLVPGTYYLVVEGYRGYAGAYRLSVEGCSTDPVPTGNCELVKSENFNSTNIGTRIPSQFNNPDWSYGICFDNDPFDNRLDAQVESINGGRRMVLNSDQYFYSDISYSYSEENEGVQVLEWDLGLRYINGDLSGGMIKINIINSLFDFFPTEYILEYGNASDENFATWSSRPIAGSDNGIIQLAEIPAIALHNGSSNPDFIIKLAQDLDNNVYTLYVDDLPIYTGYQDYSFVDTHVIGFAADANDDYMAVDNIEVYECEDCSIVYENDCGFISPAYINHLSDNQVSVGLTYQGIDAEAITGFEIMDETTGTVTTLDALVFDNCIPGRSYRFCVLYNDADGCPQACCYRIWIPLNCQYFSPFYSGDAASIEYNMIADDLPTDWTVEQWYVDSDAIGNATEITVEYDSPTTSYVCLLLHDPISQQHVFCCRKLCADIALDCNNITWTYDNDNQSYDLQVAGAAVVLSWNIDIPIGLPNNGLISDPSRFAPAEYGISPGQSITVSVRYRDASGCIKVCCIILTPPTPPDAPIIDITEACGAVGSTISIPVRSFNFESIGSLGLEIRSTNFNLARLVGIDNIHPQLSGLTWNEINERIIIGWDDSQGGSINLPDGTLLWNILVSLEAEFQDPITMYGNNVEVLNQNLSNLSGAVNQGSACITDGTSVAGQVFNPSGEALIGFEVRAHAASLETTVTNSSGAYAFDDLAGSMVEIEGYKNDNIKEGITNADVARIRRHFLQVNPIDSDYDLIAADVNRSGTITNADVAIARRIFLEVLTGEIPNNTSWRFVPEAVDISSNPLDINLQDRIIIENPNGNVTDANLIGIKVGDVNRSVNIKENDDSASSRAPMKFIIRDTSITSGAAVQIPLYVEDFEGVSLFAFELAYDPALITITNVEAIDLPGFTAQNYNITENKVIIGWDEPTGSAATFIDRPLLMISMTTPPETTASTSLVMNNPEILDINFEEIPFEYKGGQISIGTTSISEITQQTSITPNPSSDQYVLYSNQPASVQIYDRNGQLIHQASTTPISDDHQVVFGQSWLPGIYLARVTTATEIRTIKIIKI